MTELKIVPIGKSEALQLPATKNKALDNSNFDDLLECAYEELYNEEENNPVIDYLIQYEDSDDDTKNAIFNDLSNKQGIESLIDILKYIENNL